MSESSCHQEDILMNELSVNNLLQEANPKDIISLIGDRGDRSSYKSLRKNVMGLEFPNPVGVAAGLDRNGKLFNHLLDRGFGFVEIGTVTPKPVVESIKKVIKLSPDERTIISSGEFPNDGFDSVRRNLSKVSNNGLIGVNITANIESKDKISDFVLGINKFNDIVDYIVLNIPLSFDVYTGGLMDPKIDDIRNLFEKISNECEKKVPLLLKIHSYPDLDPRNYQRSRPKLKSICDSIKTYDMDGLVISDAIPHWITDKGLGTKSGFVARISGNKIFEWSTWTIRDAREFLGSGHTIIGVGGISSGSDAIEKLVAGADLVQIYTGIILEKSNLIDNILQSLKEKQKKVNQYKDQVIYSPWVKHSSEPKFELIKSLVDFGYKELGLSNLLFIDGGRQTADYNPDTNTVNIPTTSFEWENYSKGIEFTIFHELAHVLQIERKLMVKIMEFLPSVDKKILVVSWNENGNMETILKWSQKCFGLEWVDQYYEIRKDDIDLDNKKLNFKGIIERGAIASSDKTKEQKKYVYNTIPWEIHAHEVANNLLKKWNKEDEN